MDKNRASLYLAIGIVGLIVTVAAVRGVTSFFSRAETARELQEIQARQTPVSAPSPALTQATEEGFGPQARPFPRNLLGLCQEDAGFDADFDVNGDGCIRQNDWDIYGR